MGAIFMKGLIDFKLSNALRKGANLGNAKDGIYWIDFRFEKIPRCCFSCGMFGHDESECVSRKKVEEDGRIFVPKELGSWIKAESMGRRIAWPGVKRDVQMGSKGGKEKMLKLKEKARDGEMDTEKQEGKDKNERRVEGIAQYVMEGKGGNKRRVSGPMLIDVEAVSEKECNIEDLVVMKEDKNVEERDTEGVVEGTSNRKAGEKLEGTNMSNNDGTIVSKVVKGSKGGVMTWKCLAREKENIVPVSMAKKRIFKDLTNTWDEEAKVCSLMDEAGSWDQERIRGIFEPTVAEAILKISLSSRGRDDVWIWSLNGNGIFSVKSSYKAVHRSYSSSNSWTLYCSLWKKIWKTNLPPKIRLFVWRACRGILPTCLNLKNRGMEITTQCCVCGTEEEDTLHALVTCSELNSLWNVHVKDVCNQNDANGIFIDWFANQSQLWSKKQMELYCISAYRIWNRRNKVRLGEQVEDLGRLGIEAKKMWETVNGESPTMQNNIGDRVSGQGSLNTGVEEEWRAPSWREMKINVDASLKEQGKSGISCVVRNYQGRCLAAFAKKIPNVDEVDLLEAYAFLEGLELAKRLRCENIILEGDAKKVVDWVNSSAPNLSILGMLIDDIRYAMASFSTVRVQWTPRNSNLVAHRIANFACEINESQIWLEDLPSFISDVLISDCNHIFFISIKFLKYRPGS
ncbi:putative RNA-directed DNA polymerase [Senna tora]|uniref:Putative RNA-directed DNA polymerase n=1 Tax=Senna tora TaxID=362788 RepID=A0A834TR98_9FABA|nr:putative RNA-directed DNA polymerase [Senna tora]